MEALGSVSPCTGEKGEIAVIEGDKEIRRKVEFVWAPSDAAFGYAGPLSQP